jgi:CDP-diacylglycerol--serine O-phosphatidyltransferase
MKIIPNIITSLNLAAGTIAVLLTIAGDLITASWFILAAMIFDFLDGFSARLLKAYSDMGKELDSLSDLVSFGVAPALIIYNILGKSASLTEMISSGTGNVIKYVVFFIPVIMTICAALRLAKFNTDDSQITSFKGLPTPANALAVISVVIAGHLTGSEIITSFTDSSVSVIAFSLILSLLMVSRIPMLSLKFRNLKLKGNEGRYLVIIISVASVLIFGFAAITLVIPAYFLVSLLRI